MKIVALEMSMPTREFIDNHYPKDEKWITRVEKRPQIPMPSLKWIFQQELGTTDPLKQEMVRSWLVDFMASASG